MEWAIGLSVIAIGFSMLGLSCYYLFHRFGEIVEKQSTSVTATALDVSSKLAIGGLIVIILGVLYLMGVLPWWI